MLRGRSPFPFSAMLGALLLAGCSPLAAAPEQLGAAPAPATQAREQPGLRTAVFAGGCFWGVEAVFSHLRGVKSVVSGYHGGTRRQARYDLVSSGMTDHVEAVRITYDPRVVRYDQLLQVFFSVVADPTLRNRQGPDSGPQYDARLVAVSAEQARVARAYLGQIKQSRHWTAPVVTPVVRAQAFFPAEAYHQDFATRNPDHSYIRRWDAPKLAALRRLFPRLWSPHFHTG